MRNLNRRIYFVTKNGKFRVLIVDDEPGILDLISLDLESAGYVVHSTPNAVEGLEILSKQPIDLVITDIRMAEMGGIQLLREIRKKFKGPTPAVILITGHYGVSLEQVLDLGAHGMISKPFGRGDLMEKVRVTLTPASEKWVQREDFLEDLSFEIEIEDYLKAEKDHKIAFGWGGYFIHTPTVVPETGQKVRFSLTVRSPSPVVLTGGGEVVWRRTETAESVLPGVGIEFQFFTPESLPHASTWLEECQPANYIPSGRPKVS